MCGPIRNKFITLTIYGDEVKNRRYEALCFVCVAIQDTRKTRGFRGATLQGEDCSYFFAQRLFNHSLQYNRLSVRHLQIQCSAGEGEHAEEEGVVVVVARPSSVDWADASLALLVSFSAAATW